MSVPDSQTAPSYSVARMAALIAANSSILLAGMVYLGWAYTDALYGKFHVGSFELGIGAQEYVLRGIRLFSPTIFIAAVLFILVSSARTWNLKSTRIADIARLAWKRAASLLPRPVAAALKQYLPSRRAITVSAGATITASALSLAWLSNHIQVNTFLLLGLFATGPLLLTWPARRDLRGRVPYYLSVIVMTICTMWAASLYAHSVGVQAAQGIVRGLPESTAVAVYSIQRLALSGPGVTVQELPSGFLYHYRYGGLRLLTTRSGVYYLLPVNWNSQRDLTYILNGSNQVRIELY